MNTGDEAKMTEMAAMTGMPKMTGSESCGLDQLPPELIWHILEVSVTEDDLESQAAILALAFVNRRFWTLISEAYRALSPKTSIWANVSQGMLMSFKVFLRPSTLVRTEQPRDAAGNTYLAPRDNLNVLLTTPQGCWSWVAWYSFGGRYVPFLWFGLWMDDRSGTGREVLRRWLVWHLLHFALFRRYRLCETKDGEEYLRMGAEWEQMTGSPLFPSTVPLLCETKSWEEENSEENAQAVAHFLSFFASSAGGAGGGSRSGSQQEQASEKLDACCTKVLCEAFSTTRSRVPPGAASFSCETTSGKTSGTLSRASLMDRLQNSLESAHHLGLFRRLTLSFSRQ